MRDEYHVAIAMAYALSFSLFFFSIFRFQVFLPCTLVLAMNCVQLADE
jgi:hypothetical protein